MNYQTAVEYINSKLVFGSKPGLERIAFLLQKLGNPQKKLKFIHVAGTNGKGSICSFTSSIFKAAGYKTGLFVSPYVVDFRERFQINGEMISEKQLVELTLRLKVIVDQINDDKQPTEFEFITALAMLYFVENNCDVVVLEVGLGGKFDSTNVIDTPACSVIASIGIDHTAVLGETVTEIAEQKAGIIKPNGITVCYPIQPSGVIDVISSTARQNNNQLIIPDLNDITIINKTIEGSEISYQNLKLKLPVLGDVQPVNLSCAIEACKAAKGFNISDEAIEKGVKSAVFPARCEVIKTNPMVILDGGHNADGINVLAELVDRFLQQKPVAVIGMMADKDIESVLSVIGIRCEKIITVTIDNPRSITAEGLKIKALKHCDNVVAAKSVQQAIDSALSSNSPVLICGSFYLASKAKEILKFYK